MPLTLLLNHNPAQTHHALSPPTRVPVPTMAGSEAVVATTALPATNLLPANGLISPVAVDTTHRLANNRPCPLSPEAESRRVRRLSTAALVDEAVTMDLLPVDPLSLKSSIRAMQEEAGTTILDQRDQAGTRPDWTAEVLVGIRRGDHRLQDSQMLLSE